MSILAGSYGAVLLVENLPVLFIASGVIGVACVVVYVLATPDRLPQTPVLGLAWASRFLVILASFMFTTYRLLYMQQHLDLTANDAVTAVANGALLYTITLFVGTAVAGWLSDRLHRRKIFVGGSTLVFGVGLVLHDPDKPGKDLGVMNMANSLPQSLAPALALLGIGGGSDNYPALLWGTGIVAAVVIPIHGVR